MRSLLVYGQVELMYLDQVRAARSKRGEKRCKRCVARENE